MNYHMQMLRRAGSCCLLALATASGCSDSPVAPWGSEIWPLAAGNRWMFRVLEYDAAGTLLSRRTDTLTVLRDTTLGEPAFLLSRDPFKLVAGGPVVAAARADGLWMLADATHGQLLYKFPAAVGEEYFVSTGGWSRKLRIMALRERRTVPAGRFACVRYEQVNGTAYCLAPGIGPVWAEFRFYRCSGSDCALFTRTVVELLRAERR